MIVFLRLLPRQKRGWQHVALWAIFLAVALSIPAFVWFLNDGSALGLARIFAMAGLVALVFEAVARLVHRDVSP